MNRTKKLLKKMTAGIAASALILSGGSTVFAAGSYQETEKGALDKLVSGAEAYLDTYAAELDKAKAGSKATLTLTAEDAGKSLLGMASGMDFSWLNTVSMDMDVTIKDSVEAMAVDFLVNDSALCTMNVMVDMAGLAEYIQIPELSQSWMSMPLMVTATDASGAEISDEAMQQYFQAMSEIMDLVPDSETVGTLLDRYGNLIIDNLAEGSSMEEAVSVEGISEDCTVYEGYLTEENLGTIAEAVLTAAKDDQELKSLFDSWTEAGAISGDLYNQMQTGIDSLLADLSEDPEASDDAILTSKVWTNADGKIVGRELAVTDGTDSIPVFTWKNPSQDGNSALLIELSSGTESLTLTGSGQTAEGLLNGSYLAAYNGVEVADFEVENLEISPEKTGYYNGTITVSFPNNGTKEEPNPLSGFGAVINMISDAEAETSQIDLSVTSSGAPLATLSMTSGYGEGAETTDLSSLGETLSMDSEEDMMAYLQGMDWSSLLDNARAAGVPEELVTQIDAALQAAVSGSTEEAAGSATVTEEPDAADSADSTAETADGADAEASDAADGTSDAVA